MTQLRRTCHANRCDKPGRPWRILMRLAFLTVAAAAIILIHMPAWAVDLSGRYSMQNNNISASLVIEQDAEGNFRGVLKSGTGHGMVVEGREINGVGVGTGKTDGVSMYFEVYPEGDQLDFWLMPYNSNKRPDTDSARKMIFVKQVTALPDLPETPKPPKTEKNPFKWPGTDSPLPPHEAPEDTDEPERESRNPSRPDITGKPAIPFNPPGPNQALPDEAEPPEELKEPSEPPPLSGDEGLLEGKFCSIIKLEEERVASVWVLFDGVSSFEYGLVDPTGREVPSGAGVYRIKDDRVLLFYGDGSSETGKISGRDADGKITELTYEGRAFSPGSCE